MKIVRYQRSKAAYVDYIRQLVPDSVENCGDVFAGTGVLSLMLKDMGKTVYANDYLFASWVMCKALLETEEVGRDVLDEIYELNHGGYVADTGHWFVSYYGGLYFNKENACRIAGIRDEIERRYPDWGWRKAYLVCGVMMGADQCDCTSGQWYSISLRRKGLGRYREREFLVGVPPWSRRGVGFAYNMDYQDFLVGKKFDLLVCDPPDSLSLRNYRAAYHMLDTICKWDRPVVKWRIRVRAEIDMARDYLKVPYMVEWVLANHGGEYMILCLNDIGMVQPQKAYALFSKYGYSIVKQKVYVKYGRVGVRAYENAPDILEVGKAGKFMERIYLLRR